MNAFANASRWARSVGRLIRWKPRTMPAPMPLPYWPVELDASDDATAYLTDTRPPAAASGEVATVEGFQAYLRGEKPVGGEPLYSVAASGTFTNPYLGGALTTGRVLACLCDRGRAVSVTARGLGSKHPKPWEKSTAAKAPGWDTPGKSEYCPDTDRKDNWFTIDEQVNALAGCLLPGHVGGPTGFSPVHGLLVVTGATNSAKSKITRGLIYRYLHLHSRSRLKRRPHLVTFEDPIEDFFDGNGEAAEGHPARARKLFDIDYTPREKGKDVHDLPGLFRDALRQTPAAVFVGEVREQADWRSVLEFAGTGHLVVTTAHAGSLLETMIKLFAAVEAKTPADRRRFAERILGVVHMRSAGQVGVRGLLLPALWRRSEAGLSNLVAVGLGAVVPDLPDRVDKGGPDRLLVPSHTSVVGRRWFARYLMESAAKSLPAEVERAKAALEAARDPVEASKTSDEQSRLQQNGSNADLACKQLKETEMALPLNKAEIERKAIRFDLEGI